METFEHPVNKLINRLKHLDETGQGHEAEAESIRSELHGVFVIERGELEYARNTGYWYYNDQPHTQEDEDSFTAYWADVLML